MSSLLRKVKSTMSVKRARPDTVDQTAQNSNVLSHGQTPDISEVPPLPALPRKESTPNLFNRYSTLRFRRKSRIDLSTPVESPQSIQARQNCEERNKEGHSITQLPRRLVRKASTFNLHSLNRLGHTFSDRGYRNQSRRSAHLFPDIDSDPEEETEYKYTQPAQVEEHEPFPAFSTGFIEVAPSASHNDSVESINSAYTHATAIPIRQAAVALRVTQPITPSNTTPTLTTGLPVQAEAKVSEAQTLQQTHTEVNIPHDTSENTCVSMSGPAADHPLPFEKLKEITNEACKDALNDVTSYEHVKCESWNKNIINTILARLVSESQASENIAKYKFIVNSTIIQHGTGAVDPATGHGMGKRGMHAASGAYWNNEKDGMWSLKYDAAQEKGLDVIVGIVWVVV